MSETGAAMIVTTKGITTKGYAAQSATTPVLPFAYEHREPGEHDVLIDIQYCGICHSDIHQARNEWGNAPVGSTFVTPREGFEEGDQAGQQRRSTTEVYFAVRHGSGRLQRCSEN